jgi:GT2 family glycosyltransferase
MDAHPEVGLAGPRLQDAVGNLQLTCRRLPTVWSKILRRIPTGWAQTALAEELLAGYDHQTPRDVDYCIGACQVVRREALAQIGRLDEQFFYGPEDVDYCIRMWRAGWRVMYVPQAVVVHHEQRLTKRRIVSSLTLTHVLGLARFFLKWRYLWTRPQLQVRG